MKIRIFPLILLTLSMILVSCNISLPFGDSNEDKVPKKDGYIVISPSDVAKEEYMDDAAFSVKRGLRVAGISEPETITDDDSYDGNLYEVLLGQTNRPLSNEAHAMLPTYTDDDMHVFSVLIKNGDVAICASTETAYTVASKWFCANVVTQDMPMEYSAVMFTTQSIYEKEGNNATCYDASSLASDLLIEGVSLNGTALDSFDAGVFEYDIILNVRDSIPTLSLACPSFIGCSIESISGDAPAAIATVTSKDGSKSLTYKFNFIKETVSTVMDAKIEKVYGGRDAIVVIVHDDGTKNTVNYMSDQFAAHDLVGTIGLIVNKIATQSTNGTWKLNPAEVSYWQSVLNTGRFDIANHSLTHSFWGISNEDESGYYLDASGNLHEYSYKAGRITDEVVLSKQLLQQAFPGEDVLAFIKPGFGRVTDANGTTGMTQISDVAYSILAEHYIGMRDTGGGATDIPVPNIFKLSSHTVRESDTAETWKSQVNKAANKNGMVVFLFHTIVDEPTPGSLTGRTAETDAFFGWLGEQKADGKIWNTYLDTAMKYVEEYKNAVLDVKDYGDRIEIAVTDNLDNDIYDHPLTVKVPVHSSITSVTAEYPDGTESELEILSDDDDLYVQIDVVPDSEAIILHTN